MKDSPTAIDLFAGAGGLTCGLKQAGFRVIGAVESEPIVAQTYRQNHARVDLREGDICAIDAHAWMSQLGLRPSELDLLAGCPPCQGFSTLRTRNGARDNRDPRNHLLNEMGRFVEAFEPRTILMENVPGLQTKPVFREFVRSLESVGYRVQHEVHDVAEFGVPQRRRRLVMTAGHGFVVPFAPRQTRIRTVRDAIGSLPPAGFSGDHWHDLPEKRSDLMRRRIAATPPNGGGRLDWPDELRVSCHDRSDGFKDVYGRMRWDDVAPTITGGCFNPSKGRFLHPEEHRCITIREAALLQTFPKNYRWARNAGKQGAALMVGNAIPPRFVRQQAKAIREILA